MPAEMDWLVQKPELVGASLLHTKGDKANAQNQRTDIIGAWLHAAGKMSCLLIWTGTLPINATV